MVAGIFASKDDQDIGVAKARLVRKIKLIILALEGE
jgi:hypothetical protein